MEVKFEIVMCQVKYLTDLTDFRSEKSINWIKWKIRSKRRQGGKSYYLPYLTCIQDISIPPHTGLSGFESLDNSEETLSTKVYKEMVCHPSNSKSVEINNFLQAGKACSFDVVSFSNCLVGNFFPCQLYDN